MNKGLLVSKYDFARAIDVKASEITKYVEDLYTYKPKESVEKIYFSAKNVALFYNRTRDKSDKRAWLGFVYTTLSALESEGNLEKIQDFFIELLNE